MNIYIKKQNFFWKRILIGIGTLVFLLVFLNVFESQIKNTFYYIFSPITKSSLIIGNNSLAFFESFFNAKNLKYENNNLKQENQNLLSQIILLQESIKQNQALKKALDISKENNFKIIDVQTVGLDSQNDFILINKGSKDGILENMPVISSQKVLYGKVFKVYKNFSQVMLISNKKNVLDIKIENSNLIKNTTHGAIKGLGELSIYLDLVSLEAEIKSGDVLVTSALEGIYPKDLLVGKIISVNKNDLKPFQTAKIDSFFNLDNIDNLFVITDYKK